MKKNLTTIIVTVIVILVSASMLKFCTDVGEKVKEGKIAKIQSEKEQYDTYRRRVSRCTNVVGLSDALEARLNEILKTDRDMYVGGTMECNIRAYMEKPYNDTLTCTHVFVSNYHRKEGALTTATMKIGLPKYDDNFYRNECSIQVLSVD